MHNHGFHFEIHDLLTQFIAAMDDVLITRHNKNREAKEQIRVRYVHAPKERVIHDIVNKAQNITVPVIAVNITSIARDETRVFNKIDGFYQPVKNNNYGKITTHVRMPVPVNLSVSVNILTNYQSDMDQILSNFVPYSNPYIIICWKIPEAFGIESLNEIRSEVLWDGTINTEYPIDVTSSDKPRFIATTSFTIKGWLFPSADSDYVKNIYFVDSNFRVSSKLLFDSFTDSLSSENYSYDTTKGLLNENETVSVSGVPHLTNLYLNSSGRMVELSGVEVVIQPKDQPLSFTILGKNFNYTTNILISSKSTTLYTNHSSFQYTYYPTVSGFIIPKINYTILSKNAIHLSLPRLTEFTDINLVVLNDVGWKDTNSINTKLIFLSGL
jgi:hypothetical protein